MSGLYHRVTPYTRVWALGLYHRVTPYTRVSAISMVHRGAITHPLTTVSFGSWSTFMTRTTACTLVRERERERDFKQ